MASRALWKGSLKLSLIGIPIRVFAATDPSGEVSFRQLHRRCGTPIQLRKWCPHCEEDVQADDIVKGYELNKGEFVKIEPEDIDKVRPVSTHTIEIAQVVDAARIDALLVERPYFVAPDNAGAGSAFAVVRDALAERAAIGKVALHGREYLVALRPRDKGLVMYTLRHADEVRAIGDIKELEFADVRPKAEEVKLARKVLDSFESEAALSDYHDDYEDALRKMIKAKAAGRDIVAPKTPAAPNVVNLMDALRKSLASAGKNAVKARPATRTHSSRARVVKHAPRKKSA